MEPVALTIQLESPLHNNMSSMSSILLNTPSLVAAIVPKEKRPLYRRQTSPHFHSGHFLMDNDDNAVLLNNNNISPIALTNTSEQQHQQSRRHHNASASDVLHNTADTTAYSLAMARENILTSMNTGGFTGSSNTQQDSECDKLLPKQQQQQPNTALIGNASNLICSIHI
jgi:hypothetical protein